MLLSHLLRQALLLSFQAPCIVRFGTLWKKVSARTMTSLQKPVVDDEEWKPLALINKQERSEELYWILYFIARHVSQPHRLGFRDFCRNPE